MSSAEHDAIITRRRRPGRDYEIEDNRFREGADIGKESAEANMDLTLFAGLDRGENESVDFDVLI
jgi:hypothetical protein